MRDNKWSRRACRTSVCRAVICVFIGCCSAMSGAAATVKSDVYARAERFLFWNESRYVRNGDIQHHWIGSTDQFWYLRTNGKHEREFVLVNAVTGRRITAFDQRRIAMGLSRAMGINVLAGSLPFSVFHYTHDRNGIRFRVSDRPWTCNFKTAVCVAAPRSSANSNESVSPDGRWAVYLRGYNLWVRPTAGGAEYPLTRDGVEHYGYAGAPGDNRHFISDIRYGVSTPPQVVWSPDSRYILTHRLDERKVRDMYLIQSVPEDGSIRPKLFAYRYALSGDKNVPQVELMIFDIRARKRVIVRTPPLNEFLMTPIMAHNAWWSADGRRVYYLRFDRYSKSLGLNSADPVTGEVTKIISEASPTFLLAAEGGLHNNPTVRVLRNGDVLWYSQQDGWGHLYYYYASGRLRNEITRGDWVVRSIVRVDESEGRVYFIGSGRERGDPYYEYLYSVNFNGSGLKLLTPESANHHISTPTEPIQSVPPAPEELSSDEEKSGFSVSGRYFVDTYSTPNMPPVLVVRTASGRLVKKLENADVSRLRAGGYTPIEPFQVMAADGKDAIYGNLYRPSNFDSSKKYPVIDSIYPGPQVIRSAKDFMSAAFDNAQSLAELGFIVITIDGRGTPYRSKAFLDDVYGRMGKAGNLDDHIAGIRQLAHRYGYMDLDRVGIEGASGGGYASAHAILTHPEFYKVAVAAEGNHDQLLNYASWGETYNGPVGDGDYKDSANAPFAENLKGKLMLMCGDLDDNVPPAQTLRLVAALVKANRDFDLLIIPNGNHGAAMSSYFTRREWDYFVRNLLGAEPPANYQIDEPEWVENLMR